MGSKRPHLFVGIPSVDGKISVELHRYLTALEVTSVTGEFPFAVSVGIVTGVAPVQFARNVLCGMALQTEAEKVLMIDADMLPEPSVTKILYSDADIVVPRMYRFRHHGINGVSQAPPELATCATLVQGESRFDMTPEFDSTGMHKVDGCGTGCIAISRKVLEDPRMRVGEDDNDVPAIFRMQYNAAGRITEWEDIDFSLRASQLGYLVVADFGARCGHRKSINLDAVAELIHAQKKVELPV